MIVYGYAKGYQHRSDGTLEVQVRVPSIHGPFKQSEYKGNKVKNYTLDSNLPYYTSVELPRNPNDGDVVMLITSSDKKSEFMVIGLTGGSYHKGSNI